jgi:hypothetical protein
MFKGEKTIIVKGATIDELWQAHSDVANWAAWQDDIEWVKIEGKAQQGASFEMKPAGGPKVKLEILTFDKPSLFKDVSHLPFANMEVSTYMQEVTDGVEVKLIIEMRGFLTFIWKKVVAKAILEGHQKQYDAMEVYIKSNRK